MSTVEFYSYKIYSTNWSKSICLFGNQTNWCIALTNHLVSFIINKDLFKGFISLLFVLSMKVAPDLVTILKVLEWKHTSHLTWGIFKHVWGQNRHVEAIVVFLICTFCAAGGSASGWVSSIERSQQGIVHLHVDGRGWCVEVGEKRTFHQLIQRRRRRRFKMHPVVL